jgi:hypothetical protein
MSRRRGRVPDRGEPSASRSPPKTACALTDLDRGRRTRDARARDEGKGLIRFARPAMNAVIFERLALERTCVTRSSATSSSSTTSRACRSEPAPIVSVERLLRWKHPELGMISPAQFIPVARGVGLILPIGEWVLREACAQNAAMARRRAAADPHVGESVDGAVPRAGPDRRRASARSPTRRGVRQRSSWS